MKRRPRPWTIALALVAIAAAADAQPGILDERPGQRPPEIPIPEADLPPVTPELAPAPEALPPTTLPELRVLVRAIRIHGNTVLGDEELGAVTEQYVGRELSTYEIEQLRQQLTRLYVQRGYVTSGAVVPDQDLAGGVLEIAVVEGRVSDVEIEGNEHFWSRYLRDRILPHADAPLNVLELERRLRRIQGDPEIRALHAELRPGSRLGESLLRVRIEERTPYRLAFDASNDRNPAIGEINGRVNAALRNPIGVGDGVELSGQFGEGLRDVESLYAIPITRWDTLVALHFRWSDSEVIEDPFDELDVESDYLTGGFELSQPFRLSEWDELRLGVIAEWRRARSYVSDVGFSFSEGADRGEMTVAPVRPYLEWVRRERAQVIALRGQVSFGLSILDATDVSGRLEDATFAAGLLQAQWARRIEPLFGVEVFARGDLQVVDDPLLSIEQFAIGGHASVRGYRENQVVSDNGAAASLEIRIPLWRRPDGSSPLQLAPFVDYGYAWDDSARDPAPDDDLASVGVGLRWSPFRRLYGSLYWGYQLNDVPDEGGSLQDHGFHFLVTATAF